MPSRRVTTPRIEIRQFEVVGADGAKQGFIGHTGLAARTAEHETDNVPVVDMAPPMRAFGRMMADAIGVASLTEDEFRKIKDFIDRHEGEHKAAQKLGRATFSEAYCILPHAQPFREKKDNRYVRTRFSCAGVVFEAYGRARLKLVDLGRLPTVSLDDLKTAYSQQATFLDSADFRNRLGLVGDGPWPVLLCGYLINSLARDVTAIRKQPYLARSGDEYFR